MSLEKITGPAGPLEFTVSTPRGPESARGWAIVCHPHPLHGGSLQSKVVHYLAKTFAELGMETVRFNFRGVGASDGTYDEGHGEQDDLRAVIEWCREQDPDRPIWLAGFSFGAFVATAVAARDAPACLITVAPPLHMFESSGVSRPGCPWYIVHGTEDEIVPLQAVQAWAEVFTPPPEMIVIEDATHFFHGSLSKLRERLRDALVPLSPGKGDWSRECG